MPGPKPANLKLIGGRGPGKDSSGRSVVTVPSERIAPLMPKGLPREAQAEWKRVVPLLDKLEVLAGDLHRGVLIRYVRAWAEYVELTADIAKHGRTAVAKVRDSAGNETTKRVPRPEVKFLADVRAEVNRLTADLGLSPATEAKAYASAQASRTPKDFGTNPFAAGSR
ncbi:phage terminase small subunit P27 family [Rhodococcus sp. 27YEA15]|uniref:phage terminase small subunit P27 family n=1 Tax=Rhodococcus sp. 27YEA15 TaxID=3156259 RepID=UPI003C7D04C9